MKILICKDRKTEYEAREKVTQMSDAEKKWRVQYAKRGKGWRGYQARLNSGTRVKSGKMLIFLSCEVNNLSKSYYVN